MGTFSPAHWIVALVLLGGLAALVYFVGSLMLAGAKASGQRWKLLAAGLLLPVAILAVIGLIGAASSTQAEKKAPCSDIDAFLEQCNKGAAFSAPKTQRYYPDTDVGLKPFTGKLDGE